MELPSSAKSTIRVLGHTSIVGGGELEGEQLLLRDGADVAVGARVGGTEEGVPPLDDVVAEHPIALVHGAAHQPGRAGHTNPQLAVVRHRQPLLQRPP